MVGSGAGDTVGIKHCVEVAYHSCLNVYVAGDLPITYTLDCLADVADRPDSLTHDGESGNFYPLKGHLHLVDEIQINQVVILMRKLRRTRDCKRNFLANEREIRAIFHLYLVCN